ncbi:glycosyltransferase family 2 protein [Roseisolibacter agri]|uniref:glycosyltransferase family 2 protein n=1 Tax=Roseisolibacter agri TaxID=2014610 RepID=UPI0024E04E42|nr:glycosyltransferase [Roseisolibacter agri]
MTSARAPLPPSPGTPLVSVMLPTYNQVDFVEEAVRSAVEQDYPRVQVVVADDGSTDGTDRVVLELAARYPDRVVAVVGEGHVGMTLNCNRALARCTGDLVAFHAGDDVFLPGKLRLQVDWFAEDPRRVLCGHDVEAFDNRTDARMYLMSEIVPLTSGEGAAEFICRGTLFGGVSIMVRASALPPWRYDPRVAFAADWLMWMEVLAHGGHFGHVPGVLARYRRHPENVSRNHAATRRDDQYVSLALVESRYPWLLESCRIGRGALHRSHGIAALRKGDARLARRYFGAAFREHPTLLDGAGYLSTLVPNAGGLLNRLRPKLQA